MCATLFGLDMLKIKRTKPIRLPKGFRFEIEEPIFCNDEYDCSCLDGEILLYHHKELIGSVELDLSNNHYKNSRKAVTHSWLERNYHGQGLGVLMYAKAIKYCMQKGYKIQSSGYSSEDAARVWKSKSLRQYFNIRSKIEDKKYPMDKTWVPYLKVIK